MCFTYIPEFPRTECQGGAIPLYYHDNQSMYLDALKLGKGWQRLVESDVPVVPLRRGFGWSD